MPSCIRSNAFIRSNSFDAIPIAIHGSSVFLTDQRYSFEDFEFIISIARTNPLSLVVLKLPPSTVASNIVARKMRLVWYDSKEWVVLTCVPFQNPFICIFVVRILPYVTYEAVEKEY